MSEFDRTLWDRLPKNKRIFRDDLEAAGYSFVDSFSWHTNPDGWQKIQGWCSREIGDGRYTWTGERYWFLDPDDATRFALVWT